MAAIELMQASSVLSSPNVGSAGVRPTVQPTKAPVSSEQQVQAAEKKVSEQEVRQAVERANYEMAGSNEAISFGYEKRLGMLYVQVTDRNSGEVVREIPSKEFIQHKIAMREMVGLLLDKQV
ncbi:flagellar protein FlaG [Mariprofundus micogutta]|uniref:Flagellar protein FlaG n=1 Tax=Mariprofundus micogutta TaxID=1921010 RepID=A0A1L8CJM5_9PROT|nr:flagellar protein FlaG [Mariprofundus micogutta]GAV19096.1 flagellar protein FlaG [Mariprofundus micogutta]